ncbi:MAG: methyltransferase domain-containing protein [Candidatus Paceibacterota bacterium]
MLFFDFSKILDYFLKDVRIFALEFIQPKPNEKILDVCCGTGEQVFYYSKKQALCFGIDYDEKSILKAKNRLKNKKNVFLKKADSTSLPFEDNYFDCASICLALHEKTNDFQNKTIAEMKRVVKNKGKLIFIDFSAPLPNNFTTKTIKIIEYLAGKNHFSCFKNYLRQEGLTRLLNDNCLKKQRQTFLKNDNLVIIEVINNKSDQKK